MDEQDPTIPGVTGLTDQNEAAVFKSVLDTSNIATIVLGPDFTVQWVNERVVDYFGIPREKFIGADKPMLIESTIKDRFERSERYAETVIGTFENNTDVESFECHILSGEDRDERWLEYRSKPIESDELAGGRVEHYVDITERKERERQQYERLINELPEAFSAFDSDWEVTAWNDAAAERLGIPAEEILGQNIWDEFPEIEGTTAEETLRTAMEDRETVTTEFHSEREDRWLKVQAYPQEDGIAVISTEITERKRRLSAVLEHAPLILFKFDSHGTITASQGSALSKLGLEPGQVVGESVFNLYADQPELLEGIERALEGESHRVTAEVGELAFETEYRPVTDDTGEVEEVVGVSFDITDRVEYEKRLEENDAILQQLTETTDDVFWLFDAGFTELQFVNDAYEEVWGRSIESLREDSMDFMEGIHPEDRKRVQEMIGQLQAGESTDAEYRVNPAEDFERWVSVRGEPIFGDQGEVVRAAGYARDITERREREEALETYKNQLERSNEQLQEFAYVASHDLQEPLRSVTSYLDLLETEYGDDLDEDAEFYIERATSNAEQMSTLINALLEYSRVKTDEGSFEEVDVSAVIEDMIDALSVRIQETNAEITTDSLPTVTADRNQLGQVFQNLLANAMDHGGDPPEIGVSVRETDDAWEFAVTDNGPGIPEHQHDRIFEVFKQANTDNNGEAGIGLAICQRIISRHHGDIWVESDESGSTFKFTIPKRRRD